MNDANNLAQVIVHKGLFELTAFPEYFYNVIFHRFLTCMSLSGWTNLGLIYLSPSPMSRAGAAICYEAMGLRFDQGEKSVEKGRDMEKGVVIR